MNASIWRVAVWLAAATTVLFPWTAFASGVGFVGF